MFIILHPGSSDSRTSDIGFVNSARSRPHKNLKTSILAGSDEAAFPLKACSHNVSLISWLG